MNFAQITSGRHASLGKVSAIRARAPHVPYLLIRHKTKVGLLAVKFKRGCSKT